jgi:hypothetical protein
MNLNRFSVTSPDRFFISGCQRSGTTLLRLVLESHASIQCFDESLGYNILIREQNGSTINFSFDEGILLAGFKIPRFAEQLTKKNFDDPDYGVFPTFYKGEKVIHVFRDPLDVISSMMKLKADKSVTWLERYSLSILNSMIKNQDQNSIYKEKYEYVNSLGLPSHLVGALYWEIKNQGFFDLVDNGLPVYPIAYEKLVSCPEFELAKLCNFLEIEWSAALLNHSSRPHGELDEEGKAIGNTDPNRSIDKLSIGGYRHMLSSKQIEEVKSFVENMANQIDVIFKA